MRRGWLGETHTGFKRLKVGQGRERWELCFSKWLRVCWMADMDVFSLILLQAFINRVFHKSNITSLKHGTVATHANASAHLKPLKYNG